MISGSLFFALFSHLLFGMSVEDAFCLRRMDWFPDEFKGELSGTSKIKEGKNRKKIEKVKITWNIEYVKKT